MEDEGGVDAGHGGHPADARAVVTLVGEGLDGGVEDRLARAALAGAAAGPRAALAGAAAGADSG